MNLLETFKSVIRDQNLFSKKDKLLLAVSGGVDSVVLCEFCKQAGYDFSIAHCNFQLRGEESERDERFVKELGLKYGVDVLVKKFDTDKYATKKKLSTQEAARILRYAWFKELLTPSVTEGLPKAMPASHPSTSSGLTGSTPDSRLQTFLLTGHHADDNIETVLMNFFRGTGLHGLTGIPVLNDHIRRPLLGFTKNELTAFAKENKLGWVEDSSNASSKYTRNFFRNEIIPAVSEVYPQVGHNITGNISRFKEIEKLYQLGVSVFKKKLCRVKGRELHIPVLQLMKFNNRALVYEIIAPYGFTEKQVDEVFKLAESDSGKYLQSPANDYRIIRHRHWFIISPFDPGEAENIFIEEEVNKLKFVLGNLQLKRLPAPDSRLLTTNSTACLDLKEIQFPLLLRKWKTGDYFYPLGMKKKKKLARFFIDQKLSKTDKEKAWVIESAQRIIWVVGHRIDERFKITDKTKNVLEIQLTPTE